MFGEANFNVTKKNLVNVLKYRGIYSLHYNESVYEAMIRTGGYNISKAEKVFLELN